MSQLDFRNDDELRAWLERAGIDLSLWGRGSAKQVADLWAEYRDGESRFMSDPPSRVVEVVQVNIRRGDDVLIEVEQEFKDGRRRIRTRPPAEKLKRGETPHDAAVRCLQEELGLAEDEVFLLREETEAEEDIVSTSYPGLPTHYLLHIFEATTDALPDEDFYRRNIPGEPIHRHLWGWRSNTATSEEGKAAANGGSSANR